MIADFGVLTESVATLPMLSNLPCTDGEKQSTDLHGDRLVFSPKTLHRATVFFAAFRKSVFQTLYQSCGMGMYIHSSDGSKLVNTTVRASVTIVLMQKTLML